MNKERIKEFVKNSWLEIYETNNKIMSIGLKWGYSKQLTYLGFKRNEQIKILNHLGTLNKTELINLGVLSFETKKTWDKTIV